MRQSDPYLVTALAITARAREAGRSVAVMCRDQSASSSAIAATFDLSILDVVVASDAVQMLDQLAGWFASTQQSLKLAFAANFTWMRRHIAKEAITNTAMQNGAVGAVIFIPGADLPVMTLNQAKMVLQIAAAYGQPMTMERVRELAAVIGGGFALRAVARNVVGLVPGFGWAVKGVIGYTGTLAMGYAALEFFEDGGSAEGLATKLLEVRDKVAKKAQRDHERVPKAGRTPRVPRAQRARRPKALRAPEMDVTEELVSTEKGPSDYTRLT